MSASAGGHNAHFPPRCRAFAQQHTGVLRAELHLIRIGGHNALQSLIYKFFRAVDDFFHMRFLRCRLLECLPAQGQELDLL